MPDRTWSDQQTAIFDWFAQTNPKQSQHLMVRARAGTGKTTTILEGINLAPERHILLAAFNKRIAEELVGRVQNPNAEAKTLHSIGFAAVKRYWEKLEVDTSTKRADSLTQMVCGDTVPDAVKRMVSKLHSKGREMAPHARVLGDLTAIAYQFDCDEHLETPAFQKFDMDWVEDHALRCMELAATRRPARIDFSDMIFLPVRNQWASPEYDLVVVDEAQDMNMAQLELAQLVSTANHGGRIAVVGDDRQAIYGFRGADSGSLDRLKDELEADELGLTVTYRCPTNVVAAAHHLVDDLVAMDGAPEGKIMDVAREHLVFTVRPGDFVLSRKNKDLVEVAMECIRADVRVRVSGRDIGKNLIGLIRKLGGSDIPSLEAKLDEWEDRELVRILQSKYPERADEVSDKASTIRVLMEGVAGLSELQARINDLFSDNGQGQVVCSTIHKAKGLEAPRVFILGYTLMSRKDDAALEEKNIEYVAITRSQDTLVWVNK